VSKNIDPLTISCTPDIQATVLKFKRYVVWFSGPLGTIWHSCSFYVNLTVFEIFTKNNFNSGSSQYSRPGKTFIWAKLRCIFPKNRKKTCLFETFRI